MAFTIAAPEGWTGFGGFFIGRSPPSGAPSGIGISVNHDPQVTTDPCIGSVPTPAPASNAPSVDGLVAAISARQDLQVSGVTDTVLAGYTGKRLDVQFPSQLACANHYLFAEPKGLYANGPANRWRFGSSTSTARPASSCSWTTRARRPLIAPPRKRLSTPSGSPRSRSRARAPR